MSSSPSSLVQLVCPACRRPIEPAGPEWKCPACERPFTRNQGILSFLTPEERFNESDEIAVRKRFLQEMDGAESGRLFAMSRNMAGQHNRARVRVNP